MGTTPLLPLLLRSVQYFSQQHKPQQHLTQGCSVAARRSQQRRRRRRAADSSRTPPRPSRTRAPRRSPRCRRHHAHVDQPSRSRSCSVPTLGYALRLALGRAPPGGDRRHLRRPHPARLGESGSPHGCSNLSCGAVCSLCGSLCGESAAPSCELPPSLRAGGGRHTGRPAPPRNKKKHVFIKACIIGVPLI